MPKLLATALAVVGLICIASQMFRNSPDPVVFLGGLGLVVFAAICLSDENAPA